jgi:ribosome-binding protein aMBF1 (putative translation factor)
MRKTKNAVKILDRITGNDRKLRRIIVEERINAEVAQLIYQARTSAGLTQAELADLVGTKQPVIARLEDADYQGHSLAMLQRIAAALGRRVELRLSAPTPRKRQHRAA